MLELWKSKPQGSPDQHKPGHHPKKRKAPARKYKHHEHSSEEEHRTGEEYNWKRANAIGTVTVVFAGLAAFFTYKTLGESRHQNDILAGQLVAAQRDQLGWLAPERLAVLSIIPDANSSRATFNFGLTYLNVGRSPAFRSLAIMKTAIVEVEDPSLNLDKANALNLNASESDECDRNQIGAIIEDHNTVVWPGINGPYFANMSLLWSKRAVDLLRRGLVAIRVNGCFTYTTGKEEHHSWFCEILTTSTVKPGEDWQSGHCLEGNGAD